MCTVLMVLEAILVVLGVVLVVLRAYTVWGEKGEELLMYKEVLEP